MANVLLTFKIFHDKESAQDLAEILTQNNIPNFIEEDMLVFDPSYANNELNKDYRLKLYQSDFDKANNVLATYYQEQLENVDKEHYLFNFTNEELKEVIRKPDEWGPLDYQLALKLLQERGHTIMPQALQDLRSKRLKEIAEPETASRTYIFLGYVFSIFILPVGLFLGWHWATGKKTLPNGQRVYSYDARSRKHGWRIFFIAIWLVALTMILKIMGNVF